LVVSDVPGSVAGQHALNEPGGSGADYVDGVHYHAILVIPPIDKRRWKGTCKGFIDKHGWPYLDKKIGVVRSLALAAVLAAIEKIIQTYKTKDASARHSEASYQHAPLNRKLTHCPTKQKQSPGGWLGLQSSGVWSIANLCPNCDRFVIN